MLTNLEKTASVSIPWWAPGPKSKFPKISGIYEFIFHFSERIGLLIMVIGVLLGRAYILNGMAPFALPYFVAIYVTKRDMAVRTAVALAIGGFTLGIESGILISISVMAFFLCNAVTSRAKGFTNKQFPYQVAASIVIARIAMTYFLEGKIGTYAGVLSVVEGGLGFILLNIFYQSLPFISSNKYKETLKTEEIVSFTILLASVLTGTVNWHIGDLSVDHILSRYIVILFAYIGGATISATVGVVVGLILSLVNIDSLYQMSVLSFAGLLSGLLKDAKKPGVAFGLVVSTVLLGLYGSDNLILEITGMESVIACCLLVITPTGFITALARKIPGTSEFANEQQLYTQKVRKVTAERISRFALTFQVLSESFNKYTVTKESKDREVDYFLSTVVEKTCQSCFRKETCWVERFDETRDFMEDVLNQVLCGEDLERHLHTWEWKKKCKYPDRVKAVMDEYVVYYMANDKLKGQIRESRKIVAEQLRGVSQVMKDFATEIQKERECFYNLEEEIVDCLLQLGINIQDTEIYSLEKGNIDIEMSIPFQNTHGEGEKIIAPMLSDILKESVVVKRETCSPYPNGSCRLAFGSLQKFKVEVGVSYAAKGGGFISGDCYSTIELATNKYAVAISDGMGNGQRAHEESKETLSLLRNILELGIDEKVAIKSINSVLALRTTDEIYSTLDLAIIDLNNANGKFLKIGSTPSYIKRGNKIKRVQANNIPMGVLPDFEVDAVEEQFVAGDLLIMMSDGIFEGPKNVENYDWWMRRKLQDIQSNEPQVISDILLEEVISSRGDIHDDMTVVVVRIEHNMPQWASIPVSRKA